MYIIIIIILSVALALVSAMLFMAIKNKQEQTAFKNFHTQQREQTISNTIVRPPDTTALNYTLQAYERIVLLTERMYPPQLVLKLYNATFRVKEVQALLNETIQKEYEHNLSQQIYINHKIWKLMTSVKENHIMTVNAIAEACKELNAAVYAKKIIEYYDTNDIRQQHLLLLEAIQQEAKLHIKQLL